MRTFFSHVVSIAALFAVLAFPAHAHKASDSYLSLEVDGEKISGQWDIALRDLDIAIGLDSNADAVIDWGEVRARHSEIAAYAVRSLELKSGASNCPWQVTNHLIDHHTDGAYAVLQLVAVCPAKVDSLSLDYRLLFDVDAQHRGLLKLTKTFKNSEDSQTRNVVISAIFPAENASQTFHLGASRTAWGIASELATYVFDGVKHIAIGFDHILFLVALLLPAVLVRSTNKHDEHEKQWLPVADFGSACWAVFKIVTAFTIAHSVTLSLAAFDVVRLPSRLVESVIALSVLATALDNIWPFLPRKRWLVAFSFGLIHGFGFASVLADLNLPSASLVLSLLGFNLGVEVGQIILVLMVIPIAYWSRKTKMYPRIALQAGSAVIAIVASGWLLERSLNLQLLPF